MITEKMLAEIVEKMIKLESSETDKRLTQALAVNKVFIDFAVEAFAKTVNHVGGPEARLRVITQVLLDPESIVKDMLVPYILCVALGYHLREAETLEAIR